ncbi:MAG: hypothetical protein GZ088_07225 [Acidipila sp.]|nr:hypothetical protein [Acidipila sp.]
MLVAVVILVSLAGIVILTMRHQFVSRLDRLEARIKSANVPNGSRRDLPPSVLALAARLGARGDGAPGFTTFEQSGQMWQTQGGKQMDFTARQTVSSYSSEYLWRAFFAPFGASTAADYLIDGTGGLEVKLLGAVTVARAVGGADINQGEALRYLAELPWNSDAILNNRFLDWTVIDDNTLKVATGRGADRGEVTFKLDGNGLITTASAPSRMYANKGGTMTPRPWHGRFWDYQNANGRLIPCQAEVTWTLDEGEFIYWRARIIPNSVSGP